MNDKSAPSSSARQNQGDHIIKTYIKISEKLKNALIVLFVFYYLFVFGDGTFS